MSFIKLASIGAMVLCFGCRESATTTEPAVAPAFNQDFQTAYFEDKDRLTKIQSVLPAADSLMKQFAEKNHIPGLAMGIVVDGKLIHTWNYGLADVATKRPVTSSTMFRIASMSKSVTAMAILKLRDEGKLSLDDPASKYIPQLKNQVPVSADAPVITIRHLLTHGAGFPEDNPWGDRQLADTDKEFMDFLNKKISFSNPANTAFEYSNLGFALLGKIVTVVSGKQYQEYIRENIFMPLGMTGSGYEYSKIPADQLAHGYRWLNETWNEETLLHDQPDGSWGAMGALISSVNEFAKYMALHLQAWPASNAPDSGVLKRASLREMHYPWRVNGMNPKFTYSDGRVCATVNAYCYGLGWSSDCDGKVTVSHSGGLPGFGSNWQILNDYGIGIVSLANRTYSGTARVNMAILDTIVRTAGLQKRVLPPSKILEQRKNELVSLFPDWKNAAATGIFAENFFDDFKIDSLISYARSDFAEAGKILSVGALRAENQLRGEFVLHGEKKDIKVYFTLSPENPALVQYFDMGVK